MTDSIRCGRSKIQFSGSRDSLNLLEDHLRLLGRALKDPAVCQSRATILSWVFEILVALELQSRSVDRCLILIDNILHTQNYQPECITTFCIRCVLLIIKLEGDFTDKLAELFDAFGSVLLNNSIKSLTAELAILERLPPNFLCMATFTDALQCTFDGLPVHPHQQKNLKSIRHQVICNLIGGKTPLEFNHLFIFPITSAVFNTQDASVLAQHLSSSGRGGSILERLKISD